MAPRLSRRTRSARGFLFNATSPTEIYTLSLHDALPIYKAFVAGADIAEFADRTAISQREVMLERDRKSTRLNSSHEWISYAVFCLKKKKRIIIDKFGIVQACRITIAARISDDRDAIGDV